MEREEDRETKTFEKAGSNKSWPRPKQHITWSLIAKSSAVLFLEFINACPHWGQSTSLWLQRRHNKCPSGHWYMGGVSAVSKHTGHSSVLNNWLILASVYKVVSTNNKTNNYSIYFFNYISSTHSRMIYRK